MQEPILIVDDEDVITEILSSKLSDEGYICRTANSAEDAISILKNNNFHLVLSDIKMKNMDGIDLLKFIKNEYPDTAVIMVTGITDIDIAIDAMKIGAYDYLAKPLNLDEVIINVKNAIEKRRLVIENKEYQNNLENKVFDQTREIRELLVKEKVYSSKLSDALNEVEETYHSTLMALSMALDYRDNETEGHSQRVTAYSIVIAKEMNLSKDDIKTIHVGALLHDIGKIGVLDAILKKPAKLDSHEWDEMKKHVQYGYDMINDIKFLRTAAKIVFHHQEKWDGTGYPNGLKGTEIVIGARIFAVADTYDAMTSDRPYRKALTYEHAREEIIRCSGTQFDPDVVNTFLKIPKENCLKIKNTIDSYVMNGKRIPLSISFVESIETA